MILKGHLFVDQVLRLSTLYIHDRIVTDELVVVVEGLKIELTLSHCHETPNSVFDILMIISLEVADFVHHDPLIEAAQEWS